MLGWMTNLDNHTYAPREDGPPESSPEQSPKSSPRPQNGAAEDKKGDDQPKSDVDPTNNQPEVSSTAIGATQ